MFFTNYDSRKGSELSRNENAALTFWWGTMERYATTYCVVVIIDQVAIFDNRSIRIEGTVTKVNHFNLKIFSPLYMMQ